MCMSMLQAKKTENVCPEESLHSERRGRIATAPQYFCQGHGVRRVRRAMFVIKASVSQLTKEDTAGQKGEILDVGENN